MGVAASQNNHPGIDSLGAPARLVEVLLSSDTAARAAARRLHESGSLRSATELAEAWKVAPWLLSRVNSLSLPFPAAETGSLRRAFLKAYGRSSAGAANAVAGTQALERAGIPVVAFKGIGAIAFLYGDPRQRTIHDADLLISRQDLTAALACLDQIGFTRSGPETLDEYLHFVAHAPGFAGNQAIALYGEGGAEIDLHWDLSGSGMAVKDILERAVRAPLLDTEIPVASPADCFLLTVHHSIRENLAIEIVARDFLDVQRWCAYFQERNALEAIMRRSTDIGSAIPVLAITTILADYDNTSPAAIAASILDRLCTDGQRHSAARLKELFQYQLGNGRLGKDVFYLVHSRPWRQIMRGLGAGWAGYRKSMNTIEGRLEQEASLGDRLSRLARSLPSLRGLRLARELARIKYRNQ